MNNDNEYFYDYISDDLYYETEPIFFEPFWNFKYRFQSLQRNWKLTNEFTKKHIEKLIKAAEVENNSDKYECLYSEIATPDIEYIPEQLKASTISLAISLLENFLDELSEEIAKDLNIKVELSVQKMPYINKYIMWMINGCGLNITLTKEKNRNLDAIREVRNRFIHNISRDIPENIKKTINKILGYSKNSAIIIDDRFVEFSMKEIAKLVKEIEIAYIDFYEKLQLEKE
jgi:hypothetical protein